MPFSKELDDIYHYGIETAARRLGILCERVDKSIFTGDVVARIMKSIKSSVLVIADLSKANPNVYLEVGYAWGCGAQTILIIENANDLKFDVQGQRCLVYDSIHGLEQMLMEEMKGILAIGI